MSKSLLLTALTLSLALAGCSSKIRIPEYDAPPSAQASAEKPLRIQYLGVGGQRMQYGDEVVLTGPMFSNPNFILAGPFIPLSSDHEAVDKYMPESSAASIMLVGHAHYDHLIDVPYIMEKYAPKSHLYGSKTAINTVANYVPAERMTAVDDDMATREKPGKWYYSDSGKARVMAIKSSHAPHFMGIKLMQGKYDKPLKKYPWHAFAWREGQTMAYVIDFLNDEKQPVYRIFYQDAASAEQEGVVPDLNDDKGFDVAIICPASFEQIDNYPESIMKNTQAKTYLLGHWEDFFGNDLSGTQRFVRNTNQEKFEKRINAALNGSHWARPNLFQTLQFNSQGLIKQ